MASILELMKKANKDYKNDNLIGFASSITDYDGILFPSPAANYPLYKGIPRGRFIEISGLESSGKTALASLLIAEFQRNYPNENIAFVDVEHTYDKRWAQTLGVNLDKLIYINPIGMSGEEVLTLLTNLFEAEDLGLVVLDSIAALMTQEEFEDKDIGAQTFKSMAKPIGKFLRIATEQMARNNITLIGINQLRANIGNPYQPWLEPCGKALDFFNSVLIRCGTKKFIAEDGKELGGNPENPAGFKIRFKVIKNKVTPNNRNSGFVTIRFRSGVDRIADTLDVGLLLGLIKQSGAMYRLLDLETGEVLTDNGSVLKFRGKNELRQYFHSNPKVFYDFESKVNSQLAIFEDYTGAPKLVEDEDAFIDESKIQS